MRAEPDVLDDAFLTMLESSAHCVDGAVRVRGRAALGGFAVVSIEEAGQSKGGSRVESRVRAIG